MILDGDNFYVLLTSYASRVAVKRYGWIRVSLSNRSEHKGRGLELVGLCVFCLWRILFKSHKAAAPVDEEERLKQAPNFPGWV